MSEEVFYDCVTDLNINDDLKPKEQLETNVEQDNSNIKELSQTLEPEKVVEDVIANTLKNNDQGISDPLKDAIPKDNIPQINGSNKRKQADKPKEQKSEEHIEENKLSSDSSDDELEENLSEEEKIKRQSQASAIKKEGNEKFRLQEYEEAKTLYSEAIQICPKCYKKDLSIVYSNRSVCWMKLENKEEAIKDCNKSIELNDDYIKPLLRRAQLYEATDKLDESLEDYKTLVKKNPSMTECHVACRRLNEKINERNEKLKTEMMGKLKDLGNLVLKPFGLSTNNFQMEQNTETGSYNIKFVNNSDTPGGS